MATDNRPLKILRYNSKSAYLGIYFCDEKIAGSTYLLALGFDYGPFNFITLDDTPRVKLNTATLISFVIINGNEFLAVFNNLTKLYLLKPFHSAITTFLTTENIKTTKEKDSSALCALCVLCGQ